MLRGLWRFRDVAVALAIPRAPVVGYFHFLPRIFGIELAIEPLNISRR
jgi:hypothetical protein